MLPWPVMGLAHGGMITHAWSLVTLPRADHDMGCTRTAVALHEEHVTPW